MVVVAIDLHCLAFRSFCNNIYRTQHGRTKSTVSTTNTNLITEPDKTLQANTA